MLEHDAGHADAHFLLAMVAATAGNVVKARELVERAVALDGERAEYHAQLARCWALLSREPEARAAAERAVALGVGDALTLDTLGVVYSRLGAHERAVAFFEKATALAPDNAAYQYNLAASLRFLGRFEAAEVAYEAAIAADPKLYRAHSAVAELRRQTQRSNHVGRLEALLDDVGDDVDGELHLCHALAKELEDLGRHSEAFAWLERGNARKRATLDYSIDTDRELFDAVEALFADVEADDAGYANDEPIFVVGLPRSGTTLVDRVLSSHPDVSSAGELQNFAICLKRAAGTRSSRVLDVETLHRGLEVEPEALGRAYVESTRPATGQRPRFVDKMPLNFLYIGFIARALPEAKIVCLRRHPLDTCLSNFRQLFALNFSYYNYAYDLGDIAAYYLLFDRLMAHWRRVLPGRVLEVRYEALVTDQEAQTRRLLAHCGLEWDARCLAFEQNRAAVATASAVQVRQKLYTGAIGRWRRYAAELEPVRRRLEAAGLTLDDE